jgi:hypothetical protein
MSAATTAEGRKRIRAGLALLGRAWRDACEGATLTSSGIALVFSGAVESVWRSAGDALGRIPALGAAARSALRLIGGALRGLSANGGAWLVENGAALLAGFVRLAFWTLLAGASVATVIWSAPDFDLAAALSQLLPATMAALAIALALGAALLVALAVAGLIGWGRALVTRAVVKRLLIGAGIVIGGSLVAAMIIVVLVQAPIETAPPPMTAWIVIIVVIAGAAGFAIVSFGPTRSALFAIGAHGGKEEQGRAADEFDAPFTRLHEIADAPSSRGARKVEPAAAPLVARRVPESSSPPDARERPASAPQRLYAAAAVGMALALLSVLAAFVPWTDAARNWNALWGALQQDARPARRKPVRASPERVAPPRTEMFAIDPIADDRQGDVVWRSGYRAQIMRMDDGQAVRRLALPSSACGARVILAFGSASSDGAPDANVRLARNRALWAAEWARNQLAACGPAEAPAIVAVSLGQAGGAAAAGQRRVRLIASGAGLRLFSDAAELRRQSAAIHPDLESFATFDSCIVWSAEEQARSLVSCGEATHMAR